MMHRRVGLGLLLGLIAMGGALAQSSLQPRSLQGDAQAWTQHPALRRMWERLQVACRAGCASADAALFEREALDIVQEMGPSVGLSQAQMRDHVKAIPRQALKIGAEDPAILTDYGRFLVALVGPP